MYISGDGLFPKILHHRIYFHTSFEFQLALSANNIIDHMRNQTFFIRGLSADLLL